MLNHSFQSHKNLFSHSSNPCVYENLCSSAIIYNKAINVYIHKVHYQAFFNEMSALP